MNGLKLLFVFLFTVCVNTGAVYAAEPSSSKLLYPQKDCGADKFNLFKISGFNNYPPFSWRKGREVGVRMVYEYEGFVFELAKSILNSVNIQFLQDESFDDFTQMQKALLHGRTDMSFASYYVDEAKSGQDYIYPAYFGNPFVVISRMTKKVDAEDIAGLSGYKGVIRKDEGIAALFQNILPTDTKLELAEDAKEAFIKLLSGEVDFMITSPYAAEAEARRFKIREKLHFGNKVLRHIKYFFAFSKLSPCRKYKDAFKEKYSENPIIKNGAEMEKLIQKYIRIWEEKYKDEPPLEYTPPEGE